MKIDEIYTPEFVEKNRDTSSPYRQCVEKEAPHKNKEKRPYG